MENARKIACLCLLSAALMGCGDDITVQTSCEETDCPDGQICVDGQCEPDTNIQPSENCDDSETKCGDTCINTNKDNNNCGSCGNKCEGDAQCIEGKCVKEITCAEGEEKCNDVCVSLKTDINNCGECFHTCGGSETCIDGKCSIVCASGQELCDGVCTDLSSDSLNCGACGNSCGGGTACNSGTCKLQCLENQTECANSCTDNEVEEACAETICVDLSSDAVNCGECGKKCEDGLSCVNGKCELSCLSGQTACNNICVNVMSNKENCGECGKKCTDEQECVKGACESICPDGQKLCGTECVDLSSTFLNCGTCGHACESGQVCLDGACKQDCGDRTACDGNCIDPATENNYCGAKGLCDSDDASSENYKGEPCADGLLCKEGACVCPDETPNLCLTGDRTHSCVNSQTDSAFCGCTEDNVGQKCDGVPNAVSGACEAGTCVLECKPGFADCDNKASNGCETNLNDISSCGSCDNACSFENTTAIACLLGECKPTCAKGYVDCGGKCVSLTSNNNCGACGNVCGDGKACSPDGFCQITNCKEDGGLYTAVGLGDRKIKAFCIQDVKTLLAVRDAINKGEVYPDESNVENAYILMKDMALGDVSEWTGIGSVSQPFTGIFFGNGVSISGTLSCTANNCGLFGTTNKSDKGNAILDGFNLKTTLKHNDALQFNSLGGLVGYSENTDITRTKNDGSVSGYQYIGGIVGYALNSSIRSTRSAATVSGNALGTGGIVGYADGTTMDDCHATGNISQVIKNTGGIVGYAVKTVVSNSTSAANVTITSNQEGSWHAGIVAGYVNGSEFKNCSATGEVKGRAGIGGFVGRADASLFENCSVSKGKESVTYGDTSTNAFGGFTGNGVKSTFKNCITQKDVKGGIEVGGFIGWIEGGTFENCVAEGNVESKSTYTGGFVGYTKAGSTFTQCTAKGSVTSSTIQVGGFVGISYASSFKACDALGDAKGTYQVGGLAGYAQGSVFENCFAKGNADCQTSSGTGCGGFGGYMDGCTFKDSSSAGSAKGYESVSAFVGRTTGTSQITRCGSFGNSQAGCPNCDASGLVGTNVGSSLVIDSCFAIGNQSGALVGPFMGNSGGGTVQIANSYGSGKIDGSKYYGSIIGSATGGTVAFTNLYYWTGSADKIMATGNLNANSTYNGYDYIDNKATYINGENKTALSDILNQSNDVWESRECLMGTGPGTDAPAKFTIPVLKGVTAPDCE